MAQREQPRAAWADQLDTLDDVLPVPVGLPLSVVGQDAAPTQANTDPDTAAKEPSEPAQQPTLGPVSKAKTKGGELDGRSRSQVNCEHQGPVSSHSH